MTNGGSRFARRWEDGFPGGQARLLGAARRGYGGLLGAREWLYRRGVLKSRAVGCPVISIGNLTVGGTGKTPAVEVAVQTLTVLGHRPAVVSRGYGRRSRGIQVVADTASIRLDAEEAGDEPFLLARRLPGVPVLVGGNRYQTAQRADAFQHRTLTKDLEVVMARASSPWGNGRLLPAGPLREPLTALARAGLVVATGAAALGEATAVVETVARVAPGVPVLTALVVPAECWEAGRMRPVDLSELSGTRVLAFAGIAAPAAFALTLKASGVVVAQLMPFPDHHWYAAEALASLDRRADELRADGLITTEKDWVRLRKLSLPRRPLWVLAIRLVLTSGEAAWQAAFKRACSSD